MNKPYIVCYMSMSLDARIDCPMVDKLGGSNDYYAVLKELGLKNGVSGKTTAKLEMSEPGEFVAPTRTAIGKETFSKKDEGADGFTIVLDTRGTLLWKKSEDYDQPLLIVTSQASSQEYLAYLDQQGISYVVAGKDKIDLAKACGVLKDSFGIDRLGVLGGPAINTSFLDQGLLDEIDVLVEPGIDGRASYPTLFQRAGGNQSEPTPLSFLEARCFPSGSVLLRYKTID